MQFHTEYKQCFKYLPNKRKENVCFQMCVHQCRERLYSLNKTVCCNPWRSLIHSHPEGCRGVPPADLTWCGCKGRRSRTPLPPSVLLWARWSGTSWECACQYGRPCGCTGPTHRVHLCRAYSLESPPRFLHHSSLLCSFSVRRINV